MSSFESMAPTLPPESYGLHGNAPTDECPGGFFRTCTGSNVMSQVRRAGAAKVRYNIRFAHTHTRPQRNYAIDSLVTPYFGRNVSRVNESGGRGLLATLCGVLRGEVAMRCPPVHLRRAADAFARQLYLSMLAQALIVKSAVEVQRSQNTWGTVLWQARLVLDRTPIRLCYPAFTPQSLPCAAQRDLADRRLGFY